MVRQLQPWHANLRKRQVKSPKVYVRDSGLLHRLLGIGRERLLTHPKVGCVLGGVRHRAGPGGGPHDDAYFWATHQGAEIDLILRRGERLLGVECKRADAPRMTPSIRIALEDLGLQRVAVVYPGDRRYAIADSVEAVPLSDLATPGRLFGEGQGRPLGSSTPAGCRSPTTGYGQPRWLFTPPSQRAGNGSAQGPERAPLRRSRDEPQRESPADRASS